MSEPFDILGTSLEPGTLLLEASAGTGKTWSLTSIAVRLLLENPTWRIEQLLLVTYTRAATDELRRRLRDRLRETEAVLRDGVAQGDVFLQGVLHQWHADAAARERIARARRDVDLARVRTIHGFCQDVLAAGAFEAGLPLDGADHVEGDLLLRTAWRDTVRDLTVEAGAGLAAALVACDVRDGEGRAWRALEAARRHPRDRWWPEVVPLQRALDEFSAAADAIDLGLLADFVELSAAAGEWRKGHEHHQAAFAALGRGLDPSRPSRLRALFDLGVDELGKHLKVAGQKRLAEGPLAARLESLSAARAALEASLVRELCERTLTRYEDLKERHALIDHDDVIARTRARLADPVLGPALARRVGAEFRAALVDEFQDTDSDQWEIFRRLFATAGHLLLLVGDPKQAIYRFRGADIFAYLRARRSADRRATLTHNWRSTPALVEAVNTVFGRRPDESFALADIDFEPVEAGRRPDPRAPQPMEIVWVDLPAKGQSQARAEAPVLGQLVEDLIRRRAEIDTAGPDDARPRRLAVLVRTHRQARAVMRELRSAGIDVVIARGGDIHESEAMGEWRIVLRALLDPANLRLQRRARATGIWGGRLSDLQEAAGSYEEVELLAGLRRLWRERGIAVMAAELLARRETVRRWLAEEGGERRVTDLRHGLELLDRAESERGLGPEALVRWAEVEARSTDRESEERPLRLDRESEAVQVLTNFTSKGLQFDTVYLPYAWIDRDLPGDPPFEVHDPRDGTARLDFSGDPQLAPQAVLEELASRLRMHYVELTRAEERCVVYLAPFRRGFPRTAAAFLLARDESAPAPAERGPWALRAIDELGAATGAAGDRIRDRVGGPGPIRFREATDGGAHAVRWPIAQLAPPEPLVFPDARRGALVPRRQLSYTALVRSIAEAGGLPADEAELPLADRADPSDAPARAAGTGIAGFARGARAGICLHELLEHSDFTTGVDTDDRERIDRLLVRHGLRAASAHPGEIDPVEVCVDLVERLRRETLPRSTRPFSSLAGESRLDEWEFRLPVRGLVGRDLAGLLREHWAGEDWIEAAAHRLARLPARALDGMLGGFVDLLFVEDGRWTVLDWKSNDLGPAPRDYTQPAMHRAMVDHDYLVQVLFYTVAVHRYLRHRLAGYDYERHFAGVSYAFLRGWCGDPALGWCNLRPPRDLVEAVDRRLGGGA